MSTKVSYAWTTTKAGIEVGIVAGRVFFAGGWYEMADFLEAVYGVVTATDINGDDDPRIPFISCMKAMNVYGSDKGHPHFASQLAPVQNPNPRESEVHPCS